MRMRTFVTGVMLALALVFTGVALAGPSDDQYDNQVVTHVKPASGVIGATATKPAAQASGGTLPFTGLDLGIALAVGGALVGTGLVVRRAGRHSNGS